VPNSDQRIQTRTCLGFTRSSSTCNSGSTSLFYNTVGSDTSSTCSSRSRSRSSITTSSGNSSSIWVHVVVAAVVWAL
jgi:hypothetical protein